MFEKLKERLAAFKVKLDGARKSLTVLAALSWTFISSNINDIQAQLPIVHQYLGDHVSTYVNIVFGLLLIYIRLFKTNGPIEDKVVGETTPLPANDGIHG